MQELSQLSDEELDGLILDRRIREKRGLTSAVQPEPQQQQDPLRVSQPNELIPSPTLTEKIGTAANQIRRPLLVGTGAMVGGFAGIPAGPAGVLAGGALGAAGGSAADDAIATVLGQRQPEPTTIGELKDIGGRAAQEAKQDILYTGGISSLGPLSRIIGKKVLGVGSEAVKETARAAERSKIPLGIADVTEGSAVGGAKRVLGVLPFISKPFRVADAAKQAAIISQSDKILNMAGPSVSLTDLGVNMARAGRASFKEFKTVTSALYSHADDLSLNAGEIVPTSSIRSMAQESISGRNFPVLSTGATLKGKGADEVNAFITQLQDLPENISVPQLRSIQKEIGKFFGPATPNTDVRTLTMLKKATEEAMFNLNLSGVENPELIKEAYDAANRTFAQGVKKFESSTARKFVRADKRIFKSGSSQAGTINEDELARVVINTKSPKAIKDLRSLVGPENMRKAARSFIERAKAASVSPSKDKGGVIFNGNRFSKELGLDGTKQSRDALEELLRDSPLSVGELEDFSKAVSSIGEVFLPSGLVARRLSLGGVRSALNALLPGAALTSGGVTSVLSGNPGVFAAVASVYMIRKGARALSNPRNLKILTTMLDGSIPEKQRLINATRLIRMMNQGATQKNTVQ